ncbi:nuclease-related domain-containing protein [Isoptericola variabilis]|uniref:NERD domain protein n=1 Tax=Isoptericola variabilis (strain 225) TaxID=743718 RepID=F6FQ33_ISOV2|nr:nuclease-related domain-containing protein [Isoptericola variabilis]AEG44839.1 NERD domain protein [Isoptericola variabilis 225]TWH31639.1 nuclease-like protein [Isoptericola variabilis J7]
MSTAGGSADDVARRAREKAERLLRYAEQFEKGAAGEQAVQAVLDQLGPEWIVLHDVRWPGRSRANIDHVAVGPTGVFVIDAKQWSGTVTVSRGVLRQNGYARTNAVDGAHDAARAVATLVPSLDPAVFVPVVCFVGDGRPTARLGGVDVCSTSTLLRTLLDRPRILSPERLTSLRFEIELSMRSATAPAVPVPTGSSAPPRASRPSRDTRPVRRGGTSPSHLVARLAIALVLWLVASALFRAAGTVLHLPDGAVTLLTFTALVVMLLSAALRTGR